MQKIVNYEDEVTEALTDIGEIMRSDAQGVVDIYRVVVERAYAEKFSVNDTACVTN